MAKAALNMLTRTSAGEMFETDGILMTAVDTGWITDERPHQDKLRHRRRGLARAARPRRRRGPVYDPIVRGEAGEDLYGHFLKDFRPSPWLVPDRNIRSRQGEVGTKPRASEAVRRRAARGRTPPGRGAGRRR